MTRWCAQVYVPQSMPSPTPLSLAIHTAHVGNTLENGENVSNVKDIIYVGHQVCMPSITWVHLG